MIVKKHLKRDQDGYYSYEENEVELFFGSFAHVRDEMEYHCGIPAVETEFARDVMLETKENTAEFGICNSFTTTLET
jgi:hypothetical protein